MQVKILIDLAIDTHLLVQSCEKDAKLYGLLQIYDAFGDEKYLLMIAKRLWNNSSYAELMLKICGEDIFSFYHHSDWVFGFETSDENAALFKMASPSPKAIQIIYPKKMKPEELAFSV